MKVDCTHLTLNKLSETLIPKVRFLFNNRNLLKRGKDTITAFEAVIKIPNVDIVWH